MKIFTLAILTLLTTTPLMAQSRYARHISKAGASFTAKNQSLKTGYSPICSKIVPLDSDESAPLMLPRQEEEWLYEGDWTKGGDYFYVYDQYGNILKESYDDGFAISVTDNTYNSDNLPVSIIESSSEEGGPFVNSSKRLLSYDTKVTDVITESQSYTWNETDWMLIADGHTYKRVITRNDKGNITEVAIYSYFMNEYNLQQRSSITYNEDGLASTWKYEELAYSSTGELVMEERKSLSDMQWYTTDGQILVLDDLSGFFTGNNRLKKATVSSGGETTGTIEASYEESGDYSYSYIYTTAPYAKETYNHSVTDANGSYVETCTAYEDMNEDQQLTEEELAFEETLTVVIDQYGRVTSETSESDGEIMFSGKYDFTYSDEYGAYPVEQVYSEYDIEGGNYVPFLKIVALDFYDVAGITSINAGSTATGETVIYTLQGIRIDSSVDNLQPGMYIIKSNGKTGKIYKR